MKKERIITFIDVIINIIMSIILIYGSNVFNTYALKVLAYFYLVDIFEDIIVFITGLYRKRRISKKTPFGFGKTELTAELIIGLIIIFIGIFIFTKSFFLNYTNIDIKSIFILIVISILKIILANLEFKESKSTNSMINSELSKDNYLSTFKSLFLILFIYLGSMMPLFDMLGCIYISILITLKGLNIVLETYLLLTGENIKNKDTIEKIKKIINETELEYLDINIVSTKKLTKYTIIVNIKDDLSLKDIIIKEMEIKDNLRNKGIKATLIDFENHQNN